ncbi:hypothetical protein SALBM217S_01771 [Streptomyces griseoloalbus]
MTTASYDSCARYMDRRRNSAALPVGSSRGAKRAPVANGSPTRSTRNVRQSARSRSYATRYQRRPVEHQPVGFRQAPGLGAVGRPVGEPQPLVPGHRGRHHRERLRGDGRTVPAGQRSRRGLEGADTVPEPAGQHLLQFRQGPYRRLVHALQGVPGAGPQPDRDRHRLLVVQHQRRHCLPRDQPVAAVRAHRRLHGIAEVPQPLDVPAHRAPGDAEPVGQFAAGPFAGGLEEGEQLEQPCRGVRRHAPACRTTRTGSDLLGS